MQLAQQILFLALAALAIFLFAKQVTFIRLNINLGRDEALKDNPARRWRNMLLLALGQKRMFDKPLVALLHLAVYAGFIIINIEVLEIILDGIFGTHRLFAKPLGRFYIFLINSFEVLALLVLVSCLIFLIRRNILKLKRFISHDLDGWLRSDANYILITEIILMALFLTLNASDTLLQSRNVGHFAINPTGDFVISRYLHPLLNGTGNTGLEGIER